MYVCMAGREQGMSLSKVGQRISQTEVTTHTLNSTEFTLDPIAGGAEKGLAGCMKAF